MRRAFTYWLIGFLLWIIVDYTTTFCPDTTRWFSMMPRIWIYYIIFPAIMAVVIYKFQITGIRLFIATIIELCIAEIIFQNYRLFTIPIILIMFPVAIVYYCILTFVPKWIVEKTVQNNAYIISFLGGIWAIFTIIHIIQGGK